MTIERTYFKDQNFVLTLIYGKLTNEELMDHVSAMNDDYNNITGIIELADCRHISDISGLSGDGLLFSAKGEQGSTRVIGGKGAIVADTDVLYGLARMYASVASNIREDSRAFRSLEKALDFLDLGDFKKEINALLSEAAYKKRMK